MKKSREKISVKKSTKPARSGRIAGAVGLFLRHRFFFKSVAAAGILGFFVTAGVGPGEIFGVHRAEAIAPLLVWGAISLVSIGLGIFTDIGNSVISSAVEGVISAISYVLSIVVSALATVADFLLASAWEVPTVIYDEIWTVLRDFVNVLFIGVLIVAAVMIMLQIEPSKYSLKNIFGPFVVAVIGVNLSWMIGLVLLDAAKVATASVQDLYPETVPVGITLSAQNEIIRTGSTGMRDRLRQNTACDGEGWSVAEGDYLCMLFRPAEDGVFNSLVAHTRFFEWQIVEGDEFGGSFAGVIKAMTLMVFLFVLVVPLFKIVFALFLRIAMLWILFGMMPLAFAALALPDTRQYARKFWSTFLSVIFMPVPIVFVLGIALLMLPTFGKLGLSDANFAGDQSLVEGVVSILHGDFLRSILSIVALAVFLGMASKAALSQSWASEAVALGEKWGKRVRGVATYGTAGVLAVGAGAAAGAATLGGRALAGRVLAGETGQAATARLSAIRAKLADHAQPLKEGIVDPAKRFGKGTMEFLRLDASQNLAARRSAVGEDRAEYLEKYRGTKEKAEARLAEAKKSGDAGRIARAQQRVDNLVDHENFNFDQKDKNFLRADSMARAATGRKDAIKETLSQAARGANLGALSVQGAPQAAKRLWETAKATRKSHVDQQTTAMAGGAATFMTQNMSGENANAWHARARETLGLDPSTAQGLRDQLKRQARDEISKREQGSSWTAGERLARAEQFKYGTTEKDQAEFEHNLFKALDGAENLTETEVKTLRKTLGEIEAGTLDAASEDLKKTLPSALAAAKRKNLHLSGVGYDAAGRFTDGEAKLENISPDALRGDQAGEYARTFAGGEAGTSYFENVKGAHAEAFWKKGTAAERAPLENALRNAAAARIPAWRAAPSAAVGDLLTRSKSELGAIATDPVLRDQQLPAGLSLKDSSGNPLPDGIGANIKTVGQLAAAISRAKTAGSDILIDPGKTA